MSHGIRKFGAVKPLYIKVECGSCFEREVLACYEDDVHERSFVLDFFECPTCHRIVCGHCTGGRENVACSSCGSSFEKLVPEQIAKCNNCFNKEGVQLCFPCKYPHLNESLH